MSKKTVNSPGNDTLKNQALNSENEKSDNKAHTPYKQPTVGFYVESDNDNVNSKNQKKNKAASEKCRFKFKHWHLIALYLVLYDLIAVSGAYFLALWIRFDCQYSSIPGELLLNWLKFAPIYAVFCLILFVVARLYQSLWRFASFTELTRIFTATLITTVFHAAGITLLFGSMPVSYHIVGAGIQFVLILTVRFAYRFILLMRGKRGSIRMAEENDSRIMLIGAGAAGQMILRDLHKNNERVLCIIDDNRNKWDRYIDGVQIVGGRNQIISSVSKFNINKIFMAMPSAAADERKEILEICKETGCEVKNLPGMYQLLDGSVSVSAMKDVDVEDLLGRDPVKVDMDEIYSFLTGKVILVTGGGGSIGSELCRQIAKNRPKKLVILDIYENNAHAIQLELMDSYPDLSLDVIIGSVRDSKRLAQIFEKYKPEIVYHAAAHKHVPLMEYSPCEAIKNNSIGTYKTAYAALKYGCKRFVLISTDKAVNPTNIMGASKRLCEMIIQSFDRKIRENKASEIKPLVYHSSLGYSEGDEITGTPATEFVAVRFGNVLGSNGSVIPRFKEQIAAGGPVTVTHPDIIRYFMSIPEAASLVLQAGTYAKGGEIFVLDMGSPTKIDTLARNLIRLSGLKPDIDIKISYTGLRPGEKLFEEKLMSEEGLRTTPNKLIHIGNPIPFDSDSFLNNLYALSDIAYDGKNDEVHELVSEMVPTYRHAGLHGSEEKGEAYEQQRQVMNSK